MKKIKSARDIAQSVLYSVFYQGAYSNLGLNALLNKYDPSDSERAFASELVYGVIQNYRMLDKYISSFSKTPLCKLQRRVLIILRISFYQLLYLDKIPKSAVVNEAVKLTRAHLNAGAAGFVNGLLRSFLREENFKLDMPEDYVERLSLEYSLPNWMAKHFIKSYGTEKGVHIIKQSNIRPRMYIRKNEYCPLKDDFSSMILNDGAEIEKSDLIEGAYILKSKGNIAKLKSFEKGLFFFEDITSQIAANALSVKPGDTVIDLCASPGAKSFAAAQSMVGSGIIFSFDLYENRTGLIKSAAQRLNINIIECKTGDASVYDELLAERADAVLADVPCSGLGTIAKKPDIRFKKEEELLKLPHLQYSILENASRYVKKGGVLVYSTCTLNPMENENVVMSFLKNNNEFSITDIPCLEKADENLFIRRGNTVTFLPDSGLGDGFFIARMVKG